MPCRDFDNTLRRLHNNDSSETELYINRFSHPNPSDWETLGNAAGDNSLLECVIFCGNDDEPDAIDEQYFGLLCEGLLRNTSIYDVAFAGVEIPSTLGSLFQCLAPFLAKREVDNVSIINCDLDPSSCSLIAGVLVRCTFLRKISFFFNCCFDEETSAMIIKSLGGMTSLESICIDESGEWTGWDYLTNHLRFSNHTLKSIQYRDMDGIYIEFPYDLNILLHMNEMDDKTTLAIRKGLYFNFLVGKFDATPYDDIEKELKPKLLPHILATVSGGENGDSRSEGQILSALFHYVRNVARDVTSFVSD